MISVERIAAQYISSKKIFGHVSKEIDAYPSALSLFVFVLKIFSHKMFSQVT